jgi:hypothetical protein
MSNIVEYKLITVSENDRLHDFEPPCMRYFLERDNKEYAIDMSTETLYELHNAGSFVMKERIVLVDHSIIQPTLVQQIS